MASISSSRYLAILLVIAVLLMMCFEGRVAAFDSMSESSILSDDLFKLNWFSGDTKNSLFPSQIKEQISAPVMKVEDYGVTADGVTDDSAAINSALKKASEHGWAVRFPPLKIVVAGSPIIVPNGIPEIFGGMVNFTDKHSGFLLNGKYEGLTDNVKNLKIHDITIKIGKKGDYGIRGSNVLNVIIDNVVVKVSSRKGRAISLKAYADGGESSAGVVIKNNRITLPGYEDGVGIELRSERDFGRYDGAVSLWKATKTVASTKYLVKDPIVYNNAIDGGYYGISLIGVAGYSVRNNIVKNNMRNISAQHRSIRGTIYNNTLRDSVSSSIHLAYGSSDNLIRFNSIKTSVARGEGLLQAYIGTKRNIFENNVVKCTSKNGALYFVYSGIHADENIFRDNVFEGTFSRAAIAIESGWDRNLKNLAHKGMYGADETSHKWANSNTNGVVVMRNYLDVKATQKNAPDIMYSEIKDKEGSHKLTNLEILGNTISGHNVCNIVRILKLSSDNPEGILLNQ